LLQRNPSLLKTAEYRFTIESLERLKSSLGPFNTEMLNARMATLENYSTSNFRQVLADLKKNFKVQAVLKDIEPSLLSELPVIDTLDPKLRMKLSVKTAGKQFFEDINIFKLRAAINGLRAEATAIINAGSFLKGVKTVCKSSKILTVFGILIDLGFDLTNKKKSNGDDKAGEDYIADIVVDISFGIIVAAASTMLTTILTSMAIGSAFGTFIPIPIAGTVVGAIIGVGVGIIIIFVTEVITINGLSLKDWTKEFVSEIVSDIGSFSANTLNNAKEAVTSGWKNLTSSVSSSWKRLFGGNHNTQCSHSSLPKIQDYNNQTTNLQPSYSQSSGTIIKFGSNFLNRFATNH